MCPTQRFWSSEYLGSFIDRRFWAAQNSLIGFKIGKMSGRVVLGSLWVNSEGSRGTGGTCDWMLILKIRDRKEVTSTVYLDLPFRLAVTATSIYGSLTQPRKES